MSTDCSGHDPRICGQPPLLMLWAVELSTIEKQTMSVPKTVCV